MRNCSFGRWFLSGLLGLILYLGYASQAQAAGTFWVVEGNVGLGTPAYPDSSLTYLYGVSAGLTLKPNGSPLRIYLLGNFQGGYEQRDFGFVSTLERHSFDWYVSSRFVFPVARPVRIFLEGGVGARYTVRTAEGFRGRGQDEFTSLDPLLVLGAGLQARLARSLSIGYRFAVLPLETTDTPIDIFLDDNTPQFYNTVFLGVHF